MFTNLMPGLRELRAPLAAGYCWMAVIWLIWGRHIKVSENSKGFLGDVNRLMSSFPSATRLALLSFIAYIVGILSVAVSKRVVLYVNERWIVGATVRAVMLNAVIYIREGRTEEPSKRFLEQVDPNRLSRLGWRVREASDRLIDESSGAILDRGFVPANWRAVVPEEIIRLAGFVAKMETARVRRFLMRGGMEGSVPDKEIALYRATGVVVAFKAIEDLFEAVPYRLIGHDAELYNSYDRMVAESDFRASVAFPASFLAVALAITVSPFYWLAMLLVLFLFISGISRRYASFDLLASALVAGRISCPIFDEIRSRAIARDKWRGSYL